MVYSTKSVVSLGARVLNLGPCETKVVNDIHISRGSSQRAASAKYSPTNAAVLTVAVVSGLCLDASRRESNMHHVSHGIAASRLGKHRHWMDVAQKGRYQTLAERLGNFCGRELEGRASEIIVQTLPPLSPLSDLKNRHGERCSASGCAPSIACWLDAPSRLGEIHSA